MRKKTSRSRLCLDLDSQVCVSRHIPNTAGLSGPMILLAALVTAFVSAPFTLLCKGTFRWGNIRRYK